MKSKNHDLGMAIGKVDLLSFSKVPTYLPLLQKSYFLNRSVDRILSQKICFEEIFFQERSEKNPQFNFSCQNVFLFQMRWKSNDDKILKHLILHRISIFFKKNFRLKFLVSKKKSGAQNLVQLHEKYYPNYSTM